jgi:hypothetical protein
MSIVERFERLYLGDEFIREIRLDIINHACRLTLSGAHIHRLPIKPFDYEYSFQPAMLDFIDVRKVSFPDGYCFNIEIVDYEAVPTGEDSYYKFSFTMTGGWDNDTFMRTIEIIAKDFTVTRT